jgi:protein-tyrosine phosphatase
MSPRLIGFICYGNICRSPFAERYAAQRLAAHGLADRVYVDSAGIGAVSGQPSTKPAVAAAKELGVDLAPHRAKRMDELVLPPETLLVAMDRLVFGSLIVGQAATLEAARGPEGARLDLMMRFLAGTDEARQHGLDVPDPMGEGVSAYRRVYGLLQVAVDALLERLSLERPGS